MCIFSIFNRYSHLDFFFFIFVHMSLLGFFVHYPFSFNVSNWVICSVTYKDGFHVPISPTVSPPSPSFTLMFSYRGDAVSGRSFPCPRHRSQCPSLCYVSLCPVASTGSLCFHFFYNQTMFYRNFQSAAILSRGFRDFPVLVTKIILWYLSTRISGPPLYLLRFFSLKGEPGLWRPSCFSGCSDASMKSGYLLRCVLLEIKVAPAVSYGVTGSLHTVCPGHWGSEETPLLVLPVFSAGPHCR